MIWPAVLTNRGAHCAYAYIFGIIFRERIVKLHLLFNNSFHLVILCDFCRCYCCYSCPIAMQFWGRHPANEKKKKQQHRCVPMRMMLAVYGKSMWKLLLDPAPRTDTHTQENTESQLARKQKKYTKMVLIERTSTGNDPKHTLFIIDGFPVSFRRHCYWIQSHGKHVTFCNIAIATFMLHKPEIRSPPHAFYRKKVFFCCCSVSVTEFVIVVRCFSYSFIAVDVLVAWQLHDSAVDKMVICIPRRDKKTKRHISIQYAHSILLVAFEVHD